MPEKSIEMAGKSIGMSGKFTEIPWKGRYWNERKIHRTTRVYLNLEVIHRSIGKLTVMQGKSTAEEILWNTGQIYCNPRVILWNTRETYWNARKFSEMPEKSTGMPGKRTVIK